MLNANTEIMDKKDSEKRQFSAAASQDGKKHNGVRLGTNLTIHVAQKIDEPDLQPTQTETSRIAAYNSDINPKSDRFCITPCPSCTRPALRFYCSECVTNGSFSSSCPSATSSFQPTTFQSSPTFAELRLKLYEYKLDADSAVERLLRAPSTVNVDAGTKQVVLPPKKRNFLFQINKASRAANPKNVSDADESDSLLQYTQLIGQRNVIRKHIDEKSESMGRQQSVLYTYQQRINELRRNISASRDQNERVVKQQCQQQLIRIRQLSNKKQQLLSRRDAVCSQLARRQKAIIIDLVTTIFGVEPAVSNAWSSPSNDFFNDPASKFSLLKNESPPGQSSPSFVTSPKRQLSSPRTYYFIDRYPMTNLTRIVYPVIPTQTSWFKFWLDFEESKRMSLLISSTRDFSGSSSSVHGAISSKERILDRVFTKAENSDGGSDGSSSGSDEEEPGGSTRRPQRRHTMGSQQERPPRQAAGCRLRVPRALMPAISVLPNPVPAALFYLCHLNRCLKNVLFLSLPGFLFNPYEVARAAADVDYAIAASNVHNSSTNLNRVDEGDVNSNAHGVAGSKNYAQRIGRLCADVGDTLLAICITQGCGDHQTLDSRASCDLHNETTTWFVDENGERFHVDRTLLTGLLLSLVSQAGTGRSEPYSLAPLSGHQPSCDDADDDFNDMPSHDYQCDVDADEPTRPLRSSSDVRPSSFSPAGKRHHMRQASCAAALSKQRENRIDDEASDGWEKISDDDGNLARSIITSRPIRTPGALPLPENMKAYSQVINRSISTGSGFMTVMSSLWKSSVTEHNT